MASVILLFVLVSHSAIAETDQQNAKLIFCSSVETTSRSLQPAKLVDIGLELKVSLKNAYKTMNVRQTLFEHPLSGVDVTKVVTQFIPVGTSFNDAEAILKVAGFTVYPGPWSQYAPNGSSLFAGISPYEQGLLWRSNLTVFLAPKFKNKYDFVDSVSATFTMPTL